MRHQRAQGHGVSRDPKGMTYAVILVKGKQARPTWTVEVDTGDEALEKARKLLTPDVFESCISNGLLRPRTSFLRRTLAL